jgi:light-regulated signal transduction histidine kinase (bacteriophytochrome)
VLYVPIVVLTGHANEALGEEAIQRGAQDYLIKGQVDGRFLGRAIRYAITRKRIEEDLAYQAADLARVNAALARSNEELNDFADLVSHDLKEPLRGIRNYAAFLLEDYHNILDPAGRAKLETLVHLTQRMDKLISALLEYSRVGRVDLALQETALDVMVHEVVESLALSLREACVEVRLPAPLPTIRCDGVRVRQLFHNLLTNAFKYNDKPQKWIEIGCVTHPRQANWQADRSCQGVFAPVFYVRDNGIGIPARHCEAVFRIFKRLHGRDKYGGGTGMGLTMVKKIVERHDGHIWVESTPGEGSTFYFTLSRGCLRGKECQLVDGDHCM